MEPSYAVERLARENAIFAGTGGVSEENADCGFRPAFRDMATELVYPSRFADGRPAPFHMIDGLPAEVVEARDGAGHVTRIKTSLVSGFVRRGRFYTREQASAAVSELH
jgi:hypothetical protein